MRVLRNISMDGFFSRNLVRSLFMGLIFCCVVFEGDDVLWFKLNEDDDEDDYIGLCC